MPKKNETIRIEIGECLLEAINHIVDVSINQNVNTGEAVKNAFGIDFTKIVDGKFIELKK